MDATSWLALAIFLATIVVIIGGWIDRALTALLGVAVMVWAGVVSEEAAFLLVDWNVMAILISIWIIAGYFGKSGVPEWLAVQALRLSRGHGGLLVMILAALSGFVSMVVDNVVVILMFAPVALPLVRHLGLPLVPVILMIGFAANFMGTAMLLGDLPPQMLHSVAGAEFMDFIWLQGRPSSFPILTIAFVLTLGGMYLYGFRHARRVVALDTNDPAVVVAGPTPSATLGIDARIPDPRFAAIVLAMFALTILGMAFREEFGVKLGFIALSGAVLTVLVVELVYRHGGKPEFEAILGELDWRAILFYIGLFALVGAVEKTGLLEQLAHAMRPMFAASPVLGATLLYWVTVPIVGVVEHDAYILTFLYAVRDLGQQGVAPWPLYWMLLWAGTLGSNLTVAGAPALYVALNICEREERRKIPVGEFLRWSVPFVVLSSLVCYVLGMLIWVLPTS